MEALGEDYVGFTDTIKHNHEFDWRFLRLAKALEPGFVTTIAPGLLNRGTQLWQVKL